LIFVSAREWFEISFLLSSFRIWVKVSWVSIVMFWLYRWRGGRSISRRLPQLPTDL
jgi:hypothetical protein